MFDKKIILLISLLLVTGSSYIIFHHKKDNNDDEVNIVDNSDSSINDDANEEESINYAESSNSFLKYFFLFIIIVIVAIIMFFAVKKIVKKKKKTSNEEKPEELKENIENDVKNNIDNKNNTEENKENDKNKPPEKNKYSESEEFERYIKYKSKTKESKAVTPERIKDLTNRIIAKMKQDYDDYINDKKLKPKDYDVDNYLIDFYFKPNLKDEYTMELKINGGEEIENLILKRQNKVEHDMVLGVINVINIKRVREISIEKNKEIICNLFAALFDELKSCALSSKFLSGAYDDTKEDENKEKINSFFFNIINPFLECVSKRENKDIKFISEPNKIYEDFKEIFDNLKVKENTLDPQEQGKNISSFLADLSDPKGQLFNYFVKIFNDLINIYFTESRHLNEIKLENG